MPRSRRSSGDGGAHDSRRGRGGDALYGYDVVGEDGRRVHRGLTEVEAKEEAHRISSLTGEELDVVAGESPAPSVAGPAPDPEFPPIAEQLADGEDAGE